MRGIPAFLQGRRDSTLAGANRPIRAQFSRKVYFSDVAEAGLPIHCQYGQPIAPQDERKHRIALACKRTIDLVGAVVGLIVLAPLLFLIAIAIRLSDGGPALFRQERIGHLGRRFQIYKFRSVYRDHCDPYGLTSLEAHDDHLLPLGGFLRRTGLDELPQLLNILIGDMSLVGPRPHVPDMTVAGMPYHQLVPFYDNRTQMRPGLTGWAQCRGFRGSVSSHEMAAARIVHDIAYIQNFSIRLDLEILARTAIGLFAPQITYADSVGASRAPRPVNGQRELLPSGPGRTD